MNLKFALLGLAAVHAAVVFAAHPCRSDGRGNTGVSDWINCGIDTAMSLEELSALTER